MLNIYIQQNTTLNIVLKQSQEATMNILQFVSIFVTTFGVTAGQRDLIECIPGDLNVILAAPHGGYEDSDDIRDRDAGCFIDGECVWSHSCGEKDDDE